MSSFALASAKSIWLQMFCSPNNSSKSLGEQNICNHIDLALARANELIA